MSWYTPTRIPALGQLAAVLVLTQGTLLCASEAPEFRPAEVSFGGQPAPAASDSVCGLSVIAGESGPQVALTSQPATMLVCVGRGESVAVSIPVQYVGETIRVEATAALAGAGAVTVALAVGESSCQRDLSEGTSRLELSAEVKASPAVIRLTAVGGESESAVCFSNVRLCMADQSWDVPIGTVQRFPQQGPPASMLPLRPAIEDALIEWDWRMQDGIGTARMTVEYVDAIRQTFSRGDALLEDLRARGVATDELQMTHWRQLRTEFQTLSANDNATEETWEQLWRHVHQQRRRLVLANPLAHTGPLVFVKRVPSAFSHQLTQYYGRDARPGGGLFVLEQPGKSFACRQLAAELPVGSYEHPEVSYDGRRVLFAFCEVDEPPVNRDDHGDVFYHLYEVDADGSRLRHLTDGPFDDFSPDYLPDGKLLFLSTRRGGYHRCGRGPCPVYALAVAEADGSNPRPISYHETHEWDPAVLHDGRVIYTRWDYVDRHAVHYQQLWTTRPDGSDVRIFYGNNTLHPVGVWEARPIPGSSDVMATAAAHHAMTAGSIIRLNVRQGIDGLEPITRLTPDALFPESEVPVSNGGGGHWHAPVGVPGPVDVPPQAARWPGHCYRSPWPLSEDVFLAAYSFDSLIGEPKGNPANMFGLYLVDRFGNKELLYRDLNIGSLWPIPLRPRARPAAVASVCGKLPGDEAADGEWLFGQSSREQGTFFLQDVYAAWPPLPSDVVKRLRIVQVLPKSTPHANAPRVGAANASPGKQVLGTVPVEADGSAYFTAPAGIPLAFQALDSSGRAVQIMRSLAYLQPGETAACVGCHEHRTLTPPRRRMADALRRPPSTITPGPEGSLPLSYPRLVQPVLDRHCVRCHSHQKPDGNVVLTGEPAGQFTTSYNALISRVSYSAWGGKPGDFRQVNSEPLTRPGFFGARGSPLMKFLTADHYDVQLSREDLDRVVTWMDANALFYGTFNPTDQARQQRGERIEGPAIE